MSDLAGSSTVTLAAATSTGVLAARRGKRVAFSVANTGVNPVYIDMSDAEVAVAGSGVYLAPGGILTDSNFGTYQCWQGAITGVSTAGSSLSVWERVMV